MKTETTDVVRTRPTKKKFEIFTFPIAYLQMFFQSIMYKIHSR